MQREQLISVSSENQFRLVSKTSNDFGTATKFIPNRFLVLALLTFVFKLPKFPSFLPITFSSVLANTRYMNFNR